VTAEGGPTIRALLDDAERMDFFEACRRLEHDAPHLPRIGDALTRRAQAVRFGQDPFFAFPDSNLHRAARQTDGAIAVYVRFLGLTGPMGPLPLTLTDEASSFARADDDALARFFDLFNNRFIQLFFRAWADARAISHKDRPAADNRFDAYLGSSIGLGTEVYRGRDGVDDILKVAFAGLLGPKSKNASRLAQTLSAVCGERVEIEEFVGVSLGLELADRSRLGAAFAVLGENLLLGAGAYSVEDKFRVRVFAATLSRFEDFLPEGPTAAALHDMVAFYVGPELQWDVELCLPASEARGVTLGGFGRLGWTSWLAPDWAVESGRWRADARFDLASILGSRQRRMADHDS
jgi:type VI secretion system protein ImpH